MKSFRKILQTSILGAAIAVAMMATHSMTFAVSDAHATNLDGIQDTSDAMVKDGMMMCKGMRKSHGCSCHSRHDGGMGMPGRDFSERIEGRIAFLKAEIGITDSQTALWNDFAEALRGLTRMYADARAAYHKADGDQGKGMGAHKAMAISLSEALAYHETMLAARLTAIKTLRESYGKLDEELVDQQKAIADTLVGPYVSHM